MLLFIFIIIIIFVTVLIVCVGFKQLKSKQLPQNTWF